MGGDFVQTRFLGASIREFNASLGWSNQPSQLNVALVEDDKNGDKFNPPDVGFPVQFNYSGWIFNGLLQSWKRTDAVSGSPLYDVTVIDPREILDGVQLITSDYPGSTYGLFNILNVYGYYESQGFGSSDSNDAGMPWILIGNAIQNMTAIGYSSPYGQPVRFNQSSYSINLQQLPQLPYYYRIGGPKITLMEYIADICQAAGCDFFVSMLATPINTFVIQVNVINRRVLPQTGQIQNFILQQGNVTSASYGRELLNNNTGMFLVGGNMEQIHVISSSYDLYNFGQTYVQYNKTLLQNDGQFFASDGNIWPYWGVNAIGNVIIGQGDPSSNGHFFTLDAREIEVVGVSEFYATDIGEMRAAADSFESWIFYLETNNTNQESPAFGRYSAISGVSPLGNNISQIVLGLAPNSGQLVNIPWRRISALTAKQRKTASANNGGNDQLVNITRLYDFVREFATEYYGRKFMVRVPFVYTAREPESNKIQYSHNPIGAGFLSESDWPNAISNNLLPFDINELTTEDGKVEAYVRFDNIASLDLSSVNKDDYVFAEGFDSVFIKCSVEPFLLYIDQAHGFSPRAIITLSGPIRRLDNSSNRFNAALVNWLVRLYNGNQDDINAAVRKWSTEYGSESTFIGMLGKALVPIITGLPLESQIENYGPWYIQGASGKIEYEKDDALVPWNYAGYTVMNETAQAKIINALVGQIISETGNVEFPGVPVVALGSALIAGGPFVTDINVSIGQGGATTRYNMQLAPRFGKFAKANADRLTRLAKADQRLRREIRSIESVPPIGDIYYRERAGDTTKPRQVKNNSSHMFFVGECLQKQDGTYHTNVLTQPDYNFLNQSYDSYSRKAIVSADGLFAPFSTDVTASGIPHFETMTPNGSGIIPNRDTINPYIGTHGIQQVARDYSVPDNQTLYEDDGYSQNNIYRSIALRSPVMIAGWGYDVNNNPIPSGSNSLSVSNIQQHPEQWKVGPLDVRWNDDGKLWVAGGGAGLFRATSNGIVNPDNGTYNFTLFTNNQQVQAQNFLQCPICSGSPVLLGKDSGQYFVAASLYNGTTVVTNIICVSGVQTTTYNTIYTPAAIGVSS